MYVYDLIASDSIEARMNGDSQFLGQQGFSSFQHHQLLAECMITLLLPFDKYALCHSRPQLRRCSQILRDKMPRR